MKKYLNLAILSGTMIVLLTSFFITRNNTFQDLTNLKTEDLMQDFPQNSSDRFLKGMITIKLKEGYGDYSLMEGKISIGIPSLDDKLSRFGVSRLKKRFTFNGDNLRDGVPDLSRIYQIDFPSKYDIYTVVKAFSKDPHVEYAEPIPVNLKCEVPDDPLYSQMYHLPKIFAEQAWDIHHGEDGPEVLIGIVDDAVDWRHDDLVDNVWENLGEDADGDGHVIEFDGTSWIFDPDDENGIDDDGNGKIDDFVGWDFINEYGEQDNDPTPNLPAIDHGTHCIGIADGRTNNALQIASISWNVKFVTAKLSNDADQYYDYDPYDGLIYVAELGADIITNSWTSGGFSLANMEAVEYARSLGCIVVAAAGNDNNEILNYPASYPGVVSVAATTHLDLKASFSSYGIGVDICAPGLNILSLKPNNLTQQMSGTSMATPLAAGLIALAKSYYPDWSNEMVINQVMGTSDDIDYLQPYLTNKLGYGRINAYRALSETGVVTQQELRLMLFQSSFSDEDGNGIYEPGEMVQVSFTMRNFAVGLGTVPVTFTLAANSPDVEVISGECTLEVPSDDFVATDSAFSFQIDNNLDSTKLITFTISAESTLPIPLENEWTIEVLINQSGILVYNGAGSGNAYSGQYIRDFLIENSPYPVFYTQQFPSSLNGFDAVFLSFGNYGAGLSDGTLITYEMSTVISDYLYSGGYLYEDCGSFFGAMAYFGYPNLEEIEGLFSVDTVITPMTSNNIDLLAGLPGSVADGFIFNGTSQSPNYYIDIMAPDSNGAAMFEEEEYGIVAVQGEGVYGQKTICFSYSIAHLSDDTLGTRFGLMTNIAEFFGLITVGTEMPFDVSNEISLSIYPNPTRGTSDIGFSISHPGYIDLRVLDIHGRQVARLAGENRNAGEYLERFDASDLPDGLYLIFLQAGRESALKKLLIVR